MSFISIAWCCCSLISSEFELTVASLDSLKVFLEPDHLHVLWLEVAEQLLA